jgi:1,4-alpha-glucan branching enzyme
MASRDLYWGVQGNNSEPVGLAQPSIMQERFSMIILMISVEYPPYLVGGKATHVQELSRGLVKADHTVHVFSCHMERTFTLQDQGVWIHFLQFPFTGRDHQYDLSLWELTSLNRELADHARQFFVDKQSPDLIHAHEWMEFGCAELLRTVFDVPCVMTNHSVYAWMLENLNPHPESERIIGQEGHACRQADKVIAVTLSIKQEIVARYGVENSHVDVVLNGLNADIFDPERVQTELDSERERMGDWTRQTRSFCRPADRSEGGLRPFALCHEGIAEEGRCPLRHCR